MYSLWEHFFLEMKHFFFFYILQATQSFCVHSLSPGLRLFPCGTSPCFLSRISWSKNNGCAPVVRQLPRSDFHIHHETRKLVCQANECGRLSDAVFHSSWDRRGMTALLTDLVYVEQITRTDLFTVTEGSLAAPLGRKQANSRSRFFPANLPSVLLSHNDIKIYSWSKYYVMILQLLWCRNRF